ncbi:MAG: hypothetical protein EP330_07650 [Deltaproteobacteria bacterium]|nr:MAG: hypothetical protein EP330_07650 [Deltaproteobacteria bacterium]
MDGFAPPADDGALSLPRGWGYLALFFACPLLVGFHSGWMLVGAYALACWVMLDSSTQRYPLSGSHRLVLMTLAPWSATVYYARCRGWRGLLVAVGASLAWCFALFIGIVVGLVVHGLPPS